MQIIYIYIPQLISSFVKIFCSALAAPYDIAEAALLDSLIAKAKFENNRYQKPKRKPKVSTEYVDWVWGVDFAEHLLVNYMECNNMVVVR